MTNKEIIKNQLRRINAMLNANIELVQNGAKFTLAKTPFPITFASRTSSQMIEYLCGVEDTVEYLINR